VVFPLWVVENRPSPLLWPLAYTTACTTVQAVKDEKWYFFYKLLKILLQQVI